MTATGLCVAPEPVMLARIPDQQEGSAAADDACGILAGHGGMEGEQPQDDTNVEAPAPAAVVCPASCADGVSRLYLCSAMTAADAAAVCFNAHHSLSSLPSFPCFERHSPRDFSLRRRALYDSMIWRFLSSASASSRSSSGVRWSFQLIAPFYANFWHSANLFGDKAHAEEF